VNCLFRHWVNSRKKNMIFFIFFILKIMSKFESCVKWDKKQGIRRTICSRLTIFTGGSTCNSKNGQKIIICLEMLIVLYNPFIVSWVVLTSNCEFKINYLLPVNHIYRWFNLRLLKCTENYQLFKNAFFLYRTP
jgi:hypothetical protein